MLTETIHSKKHKARQRIKADTERWLAQGNRIQQLNSDQSSYQLLTRREHNEHLYQMQLRENKP